MIRSMTAFARAELEAPWGTAAWEIRSVNNRYLDVSPRLPEELRVIEPAVRERVRGRLERGKVDCTLWLVPDRGREGGLAIDEPLARRLAEAGARIAELLPGGGSLTPADLLRWPGVVRPAPLDLEAVSEAVLALLDRALEDLVAGREREGGALAEHIRRRLDAVEALADAVAARMPEVIAAARERLESRLADLVDRFDAERIEQEVALLVQKVDVAEELDRLRTHAGEVRRVLAEETPAGRRLDFLMQELNREANTLGSKSADAQTTRAAVDLKVLIEQMREQVQNVE